VLHIRSMTRSDLLFGGELSRQAGWNQTAADWQRFLTLQPDGCFVAELDDQPIGTATTCLFEHVGWIGMVLVDPSARRQGVGRALMNQAIRYLESHAANAIRLDATPMGMPLYTSLGFTTQYRLTRFAGKIQCPHVKNKEEDSQEPPWEQIATFDANLIGYSRQKLFHQLEAEPEIRTLVDQKGQEMLGYVCTRPGRLAVYVGPCMASSPEVGEGLMRQALGRYHSQEVIIDVPNDNRRAIEVMASVGLKPSRELVRMCRGETAPEPIESLWASGDPAKG